MFYIVALGSVLKLRQANAAPLLDCTSQIRLYFPHLFEHCNTVCQYSEWSDWQMVSGSTASVPTSQCPSGEAYTERRTRFSSEFNSYVQGCTNTTQSRQICKLLSSIPIICISWIRCNSIHVPTGMPDRSDIIIMSLGLGSSGNVFDSVPPPALTSTFNLRSKRVSFLFFKRLD